jgi:dolichyl-phosphate beta-glucosyltransferase
MRRLSLIIPAYNEVARILQTVAEARDYFHARQLPCEIIVSADGTDGTRETVREYAATASQRDSDIKVIGSKERRGKGIGIRDGVRLASGDIVGFSDADNKTPISEFDRIAPVLLQGHDVVIGSRGLRESRIDRRQSLHRRLGSKGFGVLMHACVGLDDIIDTQCGFKFFKGDVARDLFQHQQIDGYMFDVEILYIARQRGYSIMQVPIRWRDDGDTRLELVRGNLQNVRDLLSIRGRHRALKPRPLVNQPMVPPSDG